MRKKMEMFNFVLDSFKRGIFDFKVKRQGLIAATVLQQQIMCKHFTQKREWLKYKNRLQQINDCVISSKLSLQRDMTKALDQINFFYEACFDFQLDIADL